MRGSILINVIPDVVDPRNQLVHNESLKSSITQLIIVSLLLPVHRAWLRLCVHRTVTGSDVLKRFLTKVTIFIDDII